MKQRSLLVLLAVFIVTVALLAVNGGAAQAAGLARPQLQACAITVTNANDSGAGSLRQAIADLCDGGTITFNDSYHIILASTLNINKNVMINGVGHNIVLNGNNAVQVILVAMDGTLNLQNLTVWQGSSSLGGGGGIKTSGDLNVTNVYFANNTTTGAGGGIYVTPISSPPIITVTNSTFYQNSASEGGAISNYGSIATVTGSTFWGNSASNKGGAIEQDGWGTLVVTNSTFFLNTAAGTYGGSAIDSDDSDLSVVNSTFSGNTNLYAAIVVLYGDLTFHNNIVRRSSPRNCDLDPDTSSRSNNLADDNSCGSGFTNSPNILLGPRGAYGGNTETFPLLPGSAAIDGTSTNCPATDQRGVARGSTCDIGAFESRGFTLNISGGNNQTTFINTPFANPLELSVGSAYGEPVDGGVVAFAGPSSGASINPSSNVTATVGGSNISRNVSANGLAGSYSVTATANGASNQYFSLTNIAGTTTSLASSLNPSAYGQGVIFTATVTSGGGIPAGSVQFYADGSPLGSPVTLVGGIATATTSALSVGSHPITATYSGSAHYTASTSAVLTQIVTCFNARTVTTAADSGPGSLRQAIATVCPGGSITFGGDYAIILASELPIDRSMTIDGESHQVTVNGNHATRVFNVSAGHVTLAHLTIADGNVQTTDCGTFGAYQCGGGIFVQNSTVVVTVSHSLLSGNSAAFGGGLFNLGTVTVQQSTFSGNTAQSSGGGLATYRTATVQNSTFSGNSALTYDGGGLYSQGTTVVQNSTFSSNSAVYSGGLNNGGGGTLTLQNSTLSGNAASGVGGGVGNYATLHLIQTIIANSTSGGDCFRGTYGSIPTNDHNLIESTGTNACGLTNGSGGSLIGVDPVLSPLGNYGGSTATFALLPGSPALSAGGATCPGTDQRGKNRAGACDIGAYESQGFLFIKSGGDNQSALVNTAFAYPLRATLSEAGSNLLPGAIITYTAPASGASIMPPR